MKIGILTYHAAYNFGANLQALSTYNYLVNEGHEPVIIDFFPLLLEDAFDKSVPVEQANSHKSFLNKYFTLTKKCRNSSEVANEIKTNNIEAIIIGSDAVVQHYPILARISINPSLKRFLTFRIHPIRYETNFPNPFWGEFIEYLEKKIPIAMMSVSSQNTDYKLIVGRDKKLINKMIKNIQYISARDIRTQQLFKHVSNGEIIPKVTPDPVFAFNDNVLNSPTKDEIFNKYNLPDKYILLSFNSSKTVSKSWIASFESIANKNGYKCVAFAMPGGINFENDLVNRVNIPLDPLDWYCVIKYSSAYIGEKMHPIIVSLCNSVPFYCFDHYGILRFKLFLNEKASKIYHILERAGLKENRISIIKKINYKAPSPQFVFEKLSSFDKNKCAIFAKQMLIEYNTMMKELITKLQNL